MAGVRGMRKSCAGMSNSEVKAIVGKKYKDFCRYRWELASMMPDYKLALFKERAFDGSRFSQEM